MRPFLSAITNEYGQHPIPSMSTDFVARIHPGQPLVQVFLGDSYSTAYITPQQARILRDSLAALDLPEEN